MRLIGNLKLPAVLLGLVAALAAVPATASAAPELQTSAGAKVAVGEGIKGVSSNLVFTGQEPAGKQQCSNSTLTGKVTENSGTSIKGNVETASFAGTKNPGGTACTTTILVGGNEITFTVAVKNLPWCVYTEQSGNWDLTGKGCSGVASTTETEAPITYVETLFEKGVTNRGTCEYTSGSMIGGTYVTNTSPLKVRITAGGNLTKTGGTFPACSKTGSLSGEFTLTTSAGGALKAS